MTKTSFSWKPSAVVSPLARRPVVEMLARFRTPCHGAALALLAFDSALYWVTWWALLSVEQPLLRLALGIPCGLIAGRLFILGHDACHGSAFRLGWLNQLIGRIAFLPALTPFSTWELGHNSLHHGFTNLRGKDYSYAPFTKCEFDRLPEWRQLLERIYRNPWGPGFCYAIEIWWKKLWFPTQAAVGRRNWKYTADSLLCSAFLAAQIAASVVWAHRHGSSAAAAVLFAVVLPQLVWNGLMGFVTFQHHTHPSAVWFDDRRRWNPLASQLENTVHVEFPWLVGLLLANSMEHTAHHVDTKIPLFRLAEAQQMLEKEFPSQVIVQPWSWREYARCCRICKLYDYERQRWLDFDGQPS